MADREAATRFGLGYTTTKRFAFVVNNDRFFLTHRASWAAALSASGGQVTVIAQDTGYAQNIRDLGFNYIPLHFGRESIAPKEAIGSAFRLFFLLLKVRPNVIFLVATAAYVLGWPAAVVLRRTKFVRVITGAGRALTAESGSSPTTAIVRLALSLSARFRNVFSLFQLSSDQTEFVASKLAVTERSYIIAGTGLDTTSWTPVSKPAARLPVVLFAARLFREKGIYEFIELARAIPKDRAKFIVVGRPDSGVTSSVTFEELSSWQKEGVIDYQGESNDMLETFRSADVLVLPTTHPEGTPRTLIEAAACGVVALASDQPGCRAVVTHGITGLIAKVDEEGSFLAALNSLLDDPRQRDEMSRNARLHVREKFSLESTLRRVYESVGVEGKCQ